MLRRKRMRNESDDEMSAVSDKDIFSSSNDDKSTEETDDASNEGESSEETNDSDEEADPWRALIDSGSLVPRPNRYRCVGIAWKTQSETRGRAWQKMQKKVYDSTKK